MKPFFSVFALVFAAFGQSADAPPEWAYGFQTPPVEAPKEPLPTGNLHLTGNSLAFTRAQIYDPFGPADWYPNDHPAMPEVVAKGRKPNVVACALCHYPNGKGKPENASVAGYSREYFIQTMRDFANDKRKSSDTRKQNTNRMIGFAKNMTPAEIDAAADYYSSMKWTPWIKVVETKMVPTVYPSVGMFMPLPGAPKVPLGNRIVETPVDPEATEDKRDPHSGFVAYVPIGSVKKGEALVAKSCGVCHGADLKGLGPVPGIAGRSPSYVVRQLWDMKQGARKGTWTELMKPVVDKLTSVDMLNIAAYTASREP